MPDQDVTLQEAADLLGVHYMTAYRYVRLGLLPAHKVGSTWRVARVDLDEFREGAEQPPEPGQRGSRRRAPWAERLEARLVAGDSRGAWNVVEAALAAGTSIDGVYIDVIAPAMTSIGHRWSTGELDVGIEHRATGIAMRMIGRLGPRFSRRGRTRGGVVLGAPPGERHGLPVAMLGDLVRASGFEVSDLGADTPSSSFVYAARHTQRLVAVGISVTNPECLQAATDVITELRNELGDVTVLVGGRAVAGEEHARMMGADGWGSDGRVVTEILDRLASGRRRDLAEDERDIEGGDVAAS
jgi:excisionase family DNA binding protein